MVFPNAVALAGQKDPKNIASVLLMAAILQGDAHHADQTRVNSIIPKRIFSIPGRNTFAERVFLFIINRFDEKSLH
jgi:hypothetical protein